MAMPRKTPPKEVLLGGVCWRFNAPAFDVSQASELATASLDSPSEVAAANSLLITLKQHRPVTAVEAEGEKVVKEVERQWLQSLQEVETELAARLRVLLSESQIPQDDSV